ncbi:MAG TPA: hypothetical protein VN823_16775 [Stellaceae bacterium]|nr:hypothetical protein [Stellaceae bacterium]
MRADGSAGFAAGAAVTGVLWGALASVILIADDPINANPIGSSCDYQSMLPAPDFGWDFSLGNG